MHKNSPVTITRADGTVVKQPAYNAKQMRKIEAKPSLTTKERAILMTECPKCGARPGSNCREQNRRRVSSAVS